MDSKRLAFEDSWYYPPKILWKLNEKELMDVIGIQLNQNLY